MGISPLERTPPEAVVEGNKAANVARLSGVKRTGGNVFNICLRHPPRWPPSAVFCAAVVVLTAVSLPLSRFSNGDQLLIAMTSLNRAITSPLLKRSIPAIRDACR
eukprot:scaffold197585_cov49-Attheya_sp.AAC.1